MRTPRPPQSPDRDQRSGLWAVPSPRRPLPHPVAPGRPSPSPTATRPALIYAFPIYDFDPRTGLLLPPDPETGERKIRWDYVGQTVRTRETREAEHLEDKPWADLVAGPSMIVEQGEWTKSERDAREIMAIKRMAPRFNYDHNLDNPARVEIWRQVEQRHARDRAAGRPLWIPLHQRTLDAQIAAEKAVVGAGMDGHEPRYPLTVAWELTCALGRMIRRWPRWLQAGLAGLLLAAAGAWAGALALIDVGWPAQLAWAMAGTVAAVLLIAGLRGKAIRRWARRKKRKRT